ncbi:hypothetical protein [Geodermatophilus marinus]|uniref:hypothetical protein n=1 Tax=Geodermatophilus sp. LHW52908 TaxID=2303986 RepID=UPI000E3DDB9F|nr:hypothetical protein [Geodermatophilus sp. LHW52908]RFU23293.1 hypothetical protein D0Z06_01210 [Geodermatophilus sp. LHW52908]
MPPSTSSPVRWLLGGGAVRGRRDRPGAGAGPRPGDAARVAAELVAAGHRVELLHVPGPGQRPGDGTAHLAALLADALLADALPAGSCRVVLPAGDPAAEGLPAGVGVVLTGPGEPVDRQVAGTPGAVAAVRAADPDAEARCRALAGGRVRLGTGGGAAADRTAARCLAVLMAGSGEPGVATTDPRLVAVAGERAAWNDRAHHTWEYVMPWRAAIEQQRRLVAAGHRVRVAVPWGAGVRGGLRHRGGRS